MDRDRFDTLTRALGADGSRRTALGALFGAALFGAALETEAKKNRNKRQRRRRRRRNQEETTCFGTLECAFPSDGQDFENCDLAGSQIESCDGCTFRRADLSQTDLSEGSFQGVSFRNANLSAANLEDADVSGASFRDACLSGANFFGANTDGADFRGAIFCGTTLRDGSIDDSGCDDAPACCQPQPAACQKDAECADGCTCETRVPGPGSACVSDEGGCDFPCQRDADCQDDNPGWICVDDGFCPVIGPHCHPPCDLADEDGEVEVTRKSSGRRRGHYRRDRS